jgi:hypothetical protein
MHLPAEPAGGDAGFAAARAPDDADTPIPPAAAEMPTAPFPEPGRDTYAGARTQPTPSIPEVTAPTEPMPPIMRDTGVLGQSDAGAQPAPPQPSQHHLASRHATPTDPPPAGQVTPRLGMPPIDALAANGHGNGNGHHGAALAPRPGRARPAALARPRMVEVSGVHSRVPPEYWLDDDPIEETRLSLGLQGARAVKTEAGRPLPPPRRFKRAPRWLTIVVLLVVTAAVAACVGGAISIASIYLQRPHTTGPVPASTVAPKASPTVPKR